MRLASERVWRIKRRSDCSGLPGTRAVCVMFGGPVRIQKGDCGNELFILHTLTSFCVRAVAESNLR
jgi:hypothetical protein